MRYPGMPWLILLMSSAVRAGSVTPTTTYTLGTAETLQEAIENHPEADGFELPAGWTTSEALIVIGRNLSINGNGQALPSILVHDNADVTIAFATLSPRPNLSWAGATLTNETGATSAVTALGECATMLGATQGQRLFPLCASNASVMLYHVSVTPNSGHRPILVGNQSDLELESVTFTGSTSFLSRGLWIGEDSSATVSNTRFEGMLGGAIWSEGALSLSNTNVFAGNWASHGSDILSSGQSANLQIQGGYFHGNEGTSMSGGSLCIQGGVADLGATDDVNLEFSAHSADTGGAITVGSCGLAPGWPTVTVEHATFSQNSATDVGGALQISSGNVEVTDSAFVSNHASDGGAITIGNAAEARFEDVLLDGNSADRIGGAVRIGPTGGGTIAFKRTRFCGNTSGAGGGLAVVHDSNPHDPTQVDLGNVLFFENDASGDVNEDTTVDETHPGDAIYTTSGDDSALLLYVSFGTFINHAQSVRTKYSDAGEFILQNSVFAQDPDGISESDVYAQVGPACSNSTTQSCAQYVIDHTRANPNAAYSGFPTWWIATNALLGDPEYSDYSQCAGFELGYWSDLYGAGADANGDPVDPGWAGHANGDGDGDGFEAREECDDTSILVYPGAAEPQYWLGTNFDCDPDELAWCLPDADGDTYGDDSALPVQVPLIDGVCGPPYAGRGSDCDDDDDAVRPDAAEESGNNVDENCNGLLACFIDADGDGHGAVLSAGEIEAETCEAVSYYASVSGDCNDGDPAYHPGAIEDEGGFDKDCDELVLYFPDEDGDGQGSTEGEEAETQPDGWVTNSHDCDDSNPNIHQGADEPEISAGTDLNCDGLRWCFPDDDGDGVGTGDLAYGDYVDCDVHGGDCDDEDASVFPCTPLQPDCPADLDINTDPNCDGTRLCFQDQDNDHVGAGNLAETWVPDCSTAAGWSAYDDDCDDQNETVFPCHDGLECQPEAENEVDLDRNCDGERRCYVLDDDEDGYPGNLGPVETDSCGWWAERADCVEGNPNVHPDAEEIVGEGVDADCDGIILCYQDGDDDEMGGAVAPMACAAGSGCACDTEGYASKPGDCDDGDPAVLDECPQWLVPSSCSTGASGLSIGGALFASLFVRRRSTNRASPSSRSRAPAP